LNRPKRLVTLVGLCLRPEPVMTLPRNVADVLDRHVTFAESGADDGAAVGAGGAALPPHPVPPDDDTQQAERERGQQELVGQPELVPMWACTPSLDSLAMTGQSAQSTRAGRPVSMPDRQGW